MTEAPSSPSPCCFWAACRALPSHSAGLRAAGWCEGTASGVRPARTVFRSPLVVPQRGSPVPCPLPPLCPAAPIPAAPPPTSGAVGVFLDPQLAGSPQTASLPCLLTSFPGKPPPVRGAAPGDLLGL